MPEHYSAGHRSAPSAVAGYKGVDVTARFLLHAAANARQCISDLTYLRQQGIDTVAPCCKLASWLTTRISYMLPK